MAEKGSYEDLADKAKPDCPLCGGHDWRLIPDGSDQGMKVLCDCINQFPQK